MRLFLVDDSHVVRKRLLELSNQVPGVEVVGTAADVAEAAAALYLYRPDVLLLDIHLGERTGFDLLTVVSDVMREMQVMLLTSGAVDSYRKAAARLGVNYLFDKHKDIPLLQQVLSEMAAASRRDQ